MQVNPIREDEFNLFRKYIHQHTGIDLATSKSVMLSSRLSKRLVHNGLDSFGDYFRYANQVGNEQELQTMVDILTTNETYFFREPKHFDFLKTKILPFTNEKIRVWSAASSSGEEAFSIAMILSEFAKTKDWKILGTDISSRIIAKAQLGVYPTDRLELLDVDLMRKYCLKGVRSQQGWFRVDKPLIEKVTFVKHNLLKPLPSSVGQFDVIFLRNVLIYFDNETKKKVVEGMLSCLKKGGYFFISHSETLTRITDKLVMVQPSIYQKQ